MGKKVCKVCGRELPLSEFYKAKGYKDGHKNECKECCLEQQKQYRQDNREAIAEQKKQYYSTPNGRAYHLVYRYSQSDKEHNRGECTITPQWVIDSIFTQPCHWCGESDWTKLGCDRIDNSKPHTPDNVLPCCEECNAKRGRMTYEEFLKLKKGLTSPS